MAAQRDYYEVLRVARDADAKAIKDAFRDLALKYHPDRNKEAGVKERFKEIAEAYAVLSGLSRHGRGRRGRAAQMRGLPPHRARITHSRRDDKEHVPIQHITTCAACGGQGFIHVRPCPQCQGSGEVAQKESLTVKIPVGAEEGLALRIPGKGMPSPDTGGVAGDLFAVVRTQPDPRFERVGTDLLRQTTISVTDAVLGTNLTVPTLTGSVNVVVPPGTQPDAVLRLKQQGLPAFGEGPRGDMFLRIKVQVPERLMGPERDLYEKLRALGTQLEH